MGQEGERGERSRRASGCAGLRANGEGDIRGNPPLVFHAGTPSTDDFGDVVVEHSPCAGELGFRRPSRAISRMFVAGLADGGFEVKATVWPWM